MSNQKLIGDRMGLYLLNRARRRRRADERMGAAPPMLEELESRVLMSTTQGARHFTDARDAKATTNYVVAHKSSAAAGTPSDGLSPTDVKTAYGISSISFDGTTGDGSGQTIAIVDAYNDPNISADLHTFDVAYSLSDPTLVTINENGGRCAALDGSFGAREFMGDGDFSGRGVGHGDSPARRLYWWKRVLHRIPI